MWLTLDKENGFGNVGTVVLYGELGREFIPSLDLLPDTEEGDEERAKIQEVLENHSSSFSGTKVLYHGSTKNIMDRDFSEYEFSYILDKPKYNNKFLVSDLDNESKNLIGKSITSIAKADSTLFPTLSNVEDETSEVDYFGTILISNQLLYYFNVGAGISKIELYEGILETNHEDSDLLSQPFYEYEFLEAIGKEDLATAKPVACVHLGPKPEYRKNPGTMYFDSDPQKVAHLGNSDDLTYLEYSNLYDELNKSKVVWLVLSDGSDNLPSLNLSYNSWYNNDMPNRNKSKYCLRNDEFYGSLESTKIIDSYYDTNYLIDRRSNTILGNSEVSYNPILNRKLRSVQNLESDTERYCPSISYRSGDEVIFGGDDEVWISLEDENLGNNPYISKKWILKDKATNYYTTQIRLISLCKSQTEGNTLDINTLVSNKECGKILNGQSFVTIQNNTDEKSFVFIPNPGYELVRPEEKTGGLYVYDNSTLKELDSKYYTRTDNRSEYKYTFTVSNWEAITAQEVPTLIIMCDITYCNTIFRVSIDGGNSIGYTSWNNIYDIDKYSDDAKVSGSEFGILSYTVSGITDMIGNDPIIQDNKQDALFTFSAEETITFNFNKMKRYTIDSVTYSATKAPTNQVLTGSLENIDPYNFSFSDYIDYNTVTYTINLVTTTKSIKVIGATKYEVSDINRDINYGDEYSISFYRTTGNFENLSIKSYDIDESGGKINVQDLVTREDPDYSAAGTVKDLGDMTSGVVLYKSGDGIYTIKFKHVIHDILIYNFN